MKCKFQLEAHFGIYSGGVFLKLFDKTKFYYQYSHFTYVTDIKFCLSIIEIEIC
jgi:hypothetical protein